MIDLLPSPPSIRRTHLIVKLLVLLGVRQQGRAVPLCPLGCPIKHAHSRRRRHHTCIVTALYQSTTHSQSQQQHKINNNSSQNMFLRAKRDTAVEAALRRTAEHSSLHNIIHHAPDTNGQTHDDMTKETSLSLFSPLSISIVSRSPARTARCSSCLGARSPRRVCRHCRSSRCVCIGGVLVMLGCCYHLSGNDSFLLVCQSALDVDLVE